MARSWVVPRVDHRKNGKILVCMDIKLFAIGSEMIIAVKIIIIQWMGTKYQCRMLDWPWQWNNSKSWYNDCNYIKSNSSFNPIWDFQDSQANNIPCFSKIRRGIIWWETNENKNTMLERVRLDPPSLIHFVTVHPSQEFKAMTKPENLFAKYNVVDK